MKVNLRKIILMVALLIAITLGFVPGIDTAMTAHAEDSSGECSYCGNIAWDYTGTTLTVYKTQDATSGDMCDECQYALRNYQDTTEKLIIKPGITQIGRGAFYVYELIEEVTIPEGVTEIGPAAFSHCTSLKKVMISKGLTKISDSAFDNCKSMTSITIPEGVKEIGYMSFSCCTSLKSITIPNSVETMWISCFIGCDLQTVTLPCRYTSFSNFGCNPTLIHTHPELSYKADENTNTITEACATCKMANTAVLKAPTQTTYTGKAIVATCSNNISGFNPVIKYSGNKLTNGKPVVPGTYTATLTYNNSASVSVKYTIAPSAAPAKPHKITNVVSGVHVYWTAAAGASKYGLWRSENGVNGTYKLITSTSATHYTDTKVESGKTYHYKITTIDTVNNVHSAKSAAIGTVYVGTPDITLRVNRAAGIGLGWNKIPGATGYAIYRKPYSGNAAWTRVATITNPNTLKWDDTSVKTANGTVYKYTIRALAGSNRTILSGCRTTGRTMVRLTSRNLNSAVKTGATSIKCNWSTTTQATGYEVRFMVGDTVYKTYTIGNYKTGTKTFNDLKAGQTYKIQVRTYKKVDGVGSFYSAWSTAKTVSL